MDFLNTGIPLGEYWGIRVRLHFTFLIFAIYRVQAWGNIGFGIAYVAGLYFCILLHEFGHALAARWCDGEADEILLWPLGGLAFVRPAWNPTAHLITTVAGPFVTLVLWLLFAGLTRALATFAQLSAQSVETLSMPYLFVAVMAGLNKWLLIFNLIPAFPMDGGRILRDTLWHWMSAEKATRIAIVVSRVIAIAAIGYGLVKGEYWLIIMALFIFTQSIHEKQVVAFEAAGSYQFSIRERLHRVSRQRAFRGGVRQRAKEDAAAAFHHCASCGATEQDSTTLEFRVCTDCADHAEYCMEHLHSHRHH